jgi:hypothetical protein
MMISVFGRFERFKSVKEISSFIGINPSPYESAACVKKSGWIKRWEVHMQGRYYTWQHYRQ